MKISGTIANLAIAGRTPGEVDLVDRISQFIAETPHAFLGSGAFLALGRRLAAAGIKPEKGDQIDITPFARSITVAEAKEALKRAAAPNTSSVMDRVLLVVAEQAQLPLGDITPETVLDKIGFDSLGLVELVLAVERVLLSSRLPAAGLHPQCVDFATGVYEDTRKTLSLPTAGAYMVMTTGPATVSGNVEKPSTAEHTQLGLPAIPQPDKVAHNEEKLLRELVELFRSAPISNHPTVSEQWAKLVLSRYRLTPR